MTVLLVLVGGAVGALVRWRLAALDGARPTGTLVANLLGSLLLGLLVGAADDPALLAGLGVGVLGGLTTFSTFAVQAVELPVGPRGWYVVASVGGGVVLAAVGAAVGLAV